MIRTFVAVMLCVATAQAQERFGQRGEIVPLGGLGVGYSSNNGVSQTSLALAPGALLFFADHFAAGVQLQLSWRSGSEGQLAVPAVTQAGLAPLVAAALPVTERVQFFPQLSVAASWAWASTSTSHAVSLQAFVPLVFVPAPHIFLGFGPSLGLVLSGDNGGSGNYGLSLTSQIGGWF